MKRKQLTPYEKDCIARVKKNRARVKAECNRAGRNDPTWPKRFARLEAALLEAQPHLAEHRRCGLCPDTESRPTRRATRRVVLPNGHVLYSTWYKVPTTDADHKKAYRETQWLLANGH